MKKKIFRLFVAFIPISELVAGLVGVVFFRQPMGFALIVCAGLAATYLFLKGNTKER